MPLIHSKKPKAFSHNVETEMKAGKPQKQAVAIAYNMAGEHKAEGGCVGSTCKGCSDPACYSEGGSVDSWTKREDNEKGINKSISHGAPGMSSAGMFVRQGKDSGDDGREAAKLAHALTLKEMRSMPKPSLMAGGGEVHEDAEQDKELIDDEIHSMLGEELMAAIDQKDRKRIMEGIEAIVLSCLNKE